MLKVYVMIPAHNEEDNIEECLMSIINQTYPVDKILVILDNCNDKTKSILQMMSKKHEIITYIETINNTSFRAGALNQGLNHINCDYILIMDADSIIDENAVKEGVNFLYQYPEVGAVCSTTYAKFGSGLLWRLQKLEYGGFDSERFSTQNNINIVHGLCGMYRMKALKEVDGYSNDALLQDYDLTIKLKKQNWKIYFNPKMKAWTQPPITLKAYILQRIRWFRGGVNVIIKHGINKFTFEDALQHFIFILFFLGICIFLSLFLIQGIPFSFQLNWHPLIILTILLGYILGVIRLKYVKDLDIIDVFLRLIIIPELFIATLLMFLKIYSYILVLINRKKVW